MRTAASASNSLQQCKHPGAGLEAFSRQELLVFLEGVSRAGVRDPKVWNAYAGRALAEVSACTPEELCAVLRAFCRAGFAKRSLLNAASRKLRTEASTLPPRLLAQALSDFRRLGHLDGPLLLALAGGLASRLPGFDTFDLPLLLAAFARASVRDEVRVGEIGHALRGRAGGSEMTPSIAATAIYALALLDCGSDGTAAVLAETVVPRCLTEASLQELVNLAFALVVLDLPAGELLSYVLERIARQKGRLNAKEVHALRIVERCILLPAALRPAMRASLAGDVTAMVRCEEAVRRIVAASDGKAVECPTTSSKLQRRLESFFERLEMPHRAEGAVGPYLLDYVLPQKIAVEVDGFKHFYAFSRRPTAKSELKLRVLQAMGWRVVGLPHFEWLPRSSDGRLLYLAERIEAAAGAPLAALRRQGLGDGTRRPPPAKPRPARAPPARGAFQLGSRR